MENTLPRMVIDAVPTYPLFNENIKEKNIKLNDTLNLLLDTFTYDNYKSTLFLLMDELDGVDEFLTLTKKGKSVLKNKILKMTLDEKLVIELLGTMKRYQDLKLFNTCKHLFQDKEQSFEELGEIWKTLYALCESMTDNDLKSMMNHIPDNFKNQISSAEDWFCCALKYEIITKTDLSSLKPIFKNNRDCLIIIKNFEGSKIKSYHIKTPTIHSPCGIALILNFETFTTPNLKKREGSQIDVDSLVKLWETFGFKTLVHRDLTCSEVMEILESISMEDHTLFDAFVCCVLSHGESSIIYSSDGVRIPISKFIGIISNKCESLNKKPKLFFIQACQGTMVYQGVGKPVFEGNDIQDSSTVNMPLSVKEFNGLDVNAVVSTIDHCVSFRDPKKGGFFIQTLCAVMLKCGHEASFSDVTAEVTAEVSKIKIDLGPGTPNTVKQIVPLYSTLMKRLVLKKRADKQNINSV